MTDTPADLVFRGGHVHTVDASRPRAEAVAVQAGRIVATGNEAEIRPWIGARTRVVDLNGGLLVPGFQDAHVHPLHGGIGRLRCDLHDSPGRAGVLDTIRRYAAEHPDLPWILGAGWYMSDFPGGTPTREELDIVVPDRPTFLTNRDGHGAWANSRALELAGVDKDTSDPADGRIERRPDGTPSGTLHEGAMDLVERHVPVPGPDDWAAALRIGQAYLHSLGITAWQDAIITLEDQRTYLGAVERGELTARVEGALWWERGRGGEQVDELIERSRAVASTGSNAGRFRANSVKIMQDGVLENFTGAMVEPYLDGHGGSTDRSGMSFVDPTALRDHVRRLDAAGLQVHFHTIGDRAVREALDAIEAARNANGMTDTRPHLSHIQVIQPTDVPRFAALGAVANAQPYWACHEGQMDDLTIPFLGPERTTWQYPFKSLLRSGARLAMGSDWSVSTPNPLIEMEVAVTRVADISRGRYEPFLPDERLTLDEAMAAFTLGSAYVNHLDDVTGSIEVGKLADLVVIDRDLFA
ncbi:MAG TPA: amidohydrolase, partial [Methylomirabilota bacterium]|nr:amidohydrolase [Methylomirabilota bacterium]